MEVRFMTNMSCGHCKNAIIKTLKKTRGVKACDADLESKIVIVTYSSDTSPDKLKAVIESEGYSAQIIE